MLNSISGYRVLGKVIMNTIMFQLYNNKSRVFALVLLKFYLAVVFLLIKLTHVAYNDKITGLSLLRKHE